MSLAVEKKRCRKTSAYENGFHFEGINLFLRLRLLERGGLRNHLLRDVGGNDFVAVEFHFKTPSRCGLFGEGGVVGFDAAHGFAVIDLFAALGAFVKFEVGDGVGMSLGFSHDVAADLSNGFAAAGRTFGDGHGG